MSVVRRHNPPAVHAPLGRYHHATVHPLGNGLKRLVMAGQVGIKPDGTLPPDLGGADRAGLRQPARGARLGRHERRRPGEDHLLHHRQVARSA